MDHAPIGLASDFYRVRLRRVDAGGAPDLDWREDILYRESAPGSTGERLLFVVEAVDLDDSERVHPLGSYSDYEGALDLQTRATEALKECTRSQFEAVWFPEG
jgi:hypothetical protein